MFGSSCPFESSAYLAIILVVAGLADAAPTSPVQRRDLLTGTTTSGSVCSTQFAGTDAVLYGAGGACALVNRGYTGQDGKHAVALPAEIFAPNTPAGNGNHNPLCGRIIKITANDGALQGSVEAVIASGNVHNPGQDCGLGDGASLDLSGELWAQLGGPGFRAPAPNYSYLPKVTFQITDQYVAGLGAVV